MQLQVLCQTLFKNVGKGTRQHSGGKFKKLLRVMKLMAILLFAAFLNVSAKGYSQISLEGKNASLLKIFRLIERQTGYDFLYSYELLRSAGKVTVNVKNVPLEQALSACLKDKPLEYSIVHKTIIIKPKKILPEKTAIDDAPPPIDIRGTVVNDKGEPIEGVSILLKGSNLGTTTDAQGKYSLVLPKKGTLVFSFVGYISQQVPIGDQLTVDVVLEAGDKTLGEVVVTAMGIGKNNKSITYATQNVSAEELTKVKDVSFVNALAGKVAGAVITKGNFGPGSSTKILMRGDKSFTGNSEPLYVIDGAPMFGGSDLLANINPEDIESIQVMKGASAAALYGSQAANGVILVTTKKGRNAAPRVNFSSTFTIENAVDLPELQTTYGQADPKFNDSWGAKIQNGSDRHLKEFFKPGKTFVNAVSLSNGNEVAQVYLSYANTNAKGILPDNNLTRNNFTVRVTTQLLDKKLSLDASVNFTNQKTYNQNSAGGYSALPGIYSFPVGDDWSKYSGNNFEVWNPVRQMNVQNWPYIRNETFPNQNPYWVQKRNLNDFFRQHTITSFTAKYKFTNWLSLQGRGIYDRINDKSESRIFASTQATVAGPNGGYGLGRSDVNYFYSDVLLVANKDLSDDFSFSGTAGLSNTRTTSTSVSVSSTVPTSLSYPNYFSIFALNGLFNKSESARTTLGQAIFGNATFGYRDKLYVDVTARNEWSSTVSQPYFYPSAGISYVLLNNPGHTGFGLSYAKLRGSYAEVGNALPFGIQSWAPPYSLDNSGNINARGALPYFDGTDTINLSPERTKSYEFGADLRLLNDRLSVNLTYYTATTFDQVFQIQAPAGSGAANFWINGGTIRNRGFEGVVSYAASFKAVKWTPTLTFSRNRNHILELSTLLKADHFVLTSFNNSRVVAIFLSRPKDGKLGSYGDLYGRVYQRDEHGQLLTNEEGIPLVTPTTDKFIGNPNPDLLAGLNNTLTYKNFDFSFLVDGRFGGGVVNRTELWLDYKGLSKRTGDARDNGGVMVNGKLVDAQKYFINQTGAGASAVGSEYFYDATNIRLREVSLGYNLPVLKTVVKNLNLSFLARNLFFIYKKAPFDPEIAASTSPTTGGIASFTLPATRSFGLSLRATL